jgi:hypothetical protein
LEFPGAVYHVTSRGDRREPIFFEDEDREGFLSLLGREANLSFKEVAGLAGVSCPRLSHIQRELDLAPDDRRLRRVRRAIK